MKTIQEQINSLIKSGRDALSHARGIEDRARVADPTWDPFDWGLNALRRPERDIAIGERFSKMGIQTQVTQAKADANELFDFKVRREATGLKPGFGNLTLKEGVLDSIVSQSKGREESIDNLSAVMQYTNSSITIDKLADREAYSLSKTAPSENYLRSQAANLYDMVHDRTGMERILDDALYIDIETSGLDRQASTWQVAMKAGSEGDVQDIRMKSHLMDRGIWKTIKGFVGFDDYMVAQEGKAVSHVDRLSGFRTILERMDETEAIVGQNVSFDLEKLFRSMQEYRKVDKTGEFDKLLTRVQEKVLGEGGIRVIDTRQLMAARLGGIIPSATEELTGGYKTFSQENVALQTDLLERLKGRLSDKQWTEFEAALKKSGLHDAVVDIQVTEQIARSVLSGELSAVNIKDLENLPETLDEATRAALKSSALVPTATKLDYGTGKEMTPLEALMQGTGRIRDYKYETGSANKILRAGAFYDWTEVASKAGVTETDLRKQNLRTGAQGFLDPEFSRTIDLGDGETAVADVVGQARASSAKTIQELFRQAGAPFAEISKPERLVTSMLAEGSDVGTEAQKVMSTTTRGASGGLYMAPHQGVNVYANVAMNPEIIAEYERRTGTTLGQTFEGAEGAKRRVARISTVAPHEGTARATVVLDLFDSEEEARGFVRELKKYHSTLSGAEELEGAKNIRFLEMLDEIDALSDKGDGFKVLEDALADTFREGVQVGQYSGANTEGVVRLLDQLFPGRDTEMTKMGTILEGLTPGEGGAVRTTAAVYDAASRVDDAMMANTEGAFEAMAELEDKGSSRYGRQAAKMLSDLDGKRLSQKVMDNPKLAVKGTAGIAALGVAALLLSGGDEEERTDEPFKVRGYETARDYERYKASIGEVAEPGFQQFPVSTTPQDPLVTSGAVQYLHDTKTRRHQMGANKNAHLFGFPI